MTDNHKFLHKYSDIKKPQSKNIFKTEVNNAYWQWLYFSCQKGIIFSLKVTSMIKHGV